MNSTSASKQHYHRLTEAARPSNISNGRHALQRPDVLLRSALDMCKWNDPDLLRVVKELEKSCIAFGVDMSKLVSEKSGSEEFPIVILMQSKINEILEILHRNVKSGWVIPGLVQRTEEFLVICPKNSTAFWGFQVFGKGCTYVGDLPDGVRSGKGRLEYVPDWYYEGDFLDNMKHGLGIERFGDQNLKQHSGIFVDNIYRGNPWAQAPAPKLSLLQRVRGFLS